MLRFQIYVYNFKVCLGSYQPGRPLRRGPAGQISTSGAPSRTNIPRRRCFFKLVSAMKWDDWTKLVSSFSVASMWNRKWWGAAVPGDSQRHTSTFLPHMNTLCSTHGKTNSASSFASYSCFWCLDGYVTESKSFKINLKHSLFILFISPCFLLRLVFSARGCVDRFHLQVVTFEFKLKTF